jgi:hypothetical protein
MIQRHLVQLLAIRILIANAAMKINDALGIGKIWCIHTGINSAISSRSSQYRGAFIAPFPTEKNSILGFKSSLCHWKQFPDLFKALLPTAVCSK